MSKNCIKRENPLQNNPWDVPNIQEFLFYNCPECDVRVKDSEVFVQHALDNHKLSKESVEMVSHDQDEITTDHQMEDNQESEKIIKSSKRKRKQIIHTREEF